MSTGEAASMIGSGREMLLLDVRTTHEYEQGHLPGALHIPVNEIPRRLSELAPYSDRPILVYCRTDNRSSVARHYLARYGFKVSFMRGGVVAWSRDQRPLLR
jgi:rhodanese-related sulfurtransferase